MVLFAEAADFQAMAQPRGGAVIPRGEDPPVTDQGSADTSPETGGAFRHKLDDVQEIVIPGGPSVRFAAPLLSLFDPLHGFKDHLRLGLGYRFSRIRSG